MIGLDWIIGWLPQFGTTETWFPIRGKKYILSLQSPTTSINLQDNISSLTTTFITFITGFWSLLMTCFTLVNIPGSGSPPNPPGGSPQRGSHPLQDIHLHCLTTWWSFGDQILYASAGFSEDPESLDPTGFSNEKKRRMQNDDALKVALAPWRLGDFKIW